MLHQLQKGKPEADLAGLSRRVKGICDTGKQLCTHAAAIVGDREAKTLLILFNGQRDAAGARLDGIHGDVQNV